MFDDNERLAEIVYGQGVDSMIPAQVKQTS